jgi:outer membrane protein assembly factor BamB
LNWKFDNGVAGDWIPTMAMRGIRSSADYRDGRLYFGDGFCAVTCLDAATGKQIWKTRVQDNPALFATMMYSPTVYNGKVYVGFSSCMAEIACLDAETGAIRWRFRVVKDVPEKYQSGGGPLWTSGAIDEQQNVVFNGTGNAKAYAPAGPTLYANSVVAHDADTGELLWAYQAHPQDVNDLDFCAHPMVFDAVAPARSRGDVRRCVAAGNKANLVCLNRHTGELFWKVALNEPSANSGPHINATAVAYNSVFIQNASPSSRPGLATTASLHAYTGDIQWIVPNPGQQSSPIAVANGVLYQGLLNPAKIEALDASSGDRLWEFALPSQFRGGVAIANGAVYTSNGQPLGWRGQQLPYAHSVYCFTVDGQ